VAEGIRSRSAYGVHVLGERSSACLRIIGTKIGMSSTAAERMRLSRKRRRDGMHYVRIPLHVTEIDDLIRLRLLKEEQRHDADALQTAVMSLIYRGLEGQT
jgi:hypothetical protein